MRLTSLFSKALLALTFAFGLAATTQAQTQIGKPDSVQATAVGALPPSNCPNIQTQWYAAGQVPSGYYKQGTTPFHCLPIPACTSNQSFDQVTATCGCPAGTIWDGAYNTCHAACAAGTSWNGSACVNSCPAGTTWNGSSCASICAAGTSWNGSSCASICAAGTSWNGSSCQSICAAGTSWNGSTCASVCSADKTWDGAACSCPAGQVDVGGVCGSAPAFSQFSIAPLSQYIGSSHTVTWGTTGSGSINVSLLCSGANGASYALSPGAGGTGALPVTTPGNTACIAQATNAWGSIDASSPALSASCPPGTSWNGTSCVVAASPTDLNGKTIVVKGIDGSGAYVTALRLVGGPTGITVYSGSSSTVLCTIQPNGQKCATQQNYFLYDAQYSAQNYGRVGADAEACARIPLGQQPPPGFNARILGNCYYSPPLMNAPCYSYRPSGAVINTCPATMMGYSVTWDADGTLRLYTYYAGGQSGDTYQVGPLSYGSGSITTPQMLAAPISSELRLPGAVLPNPM